MKQSKIGLIGCGYWGPKLARNFTELPGANLTWVSDFRADRIAHMVKLYPGLKASQNYKDLLESDVDAVVIATPVSTHHKLALEALQMGKHVLIEKPLADSVERAAEIATTAEKVGRAAMVGHTFQHNPAVNVIRDLLHSGELGQIFYINATRVNLGLFQRDINVLWDLAPHDISIMLHVLNARPESVRAYGHAFVQQNIEDVIYVALKFPGNVLASLRISWLDPVKTRQITIVGSKKMLVYDDIADEKVMVFDKGVDVPAHSDTVKEFEMSYRHGGGTIVDVAWQEPLQVECQAFVDWIQTGKQATTDAWAGVQVVTVLEAASKSLKCGGNWETIQYERLSYASNRA